MRMMEVSRDRKIRLPKGVFRPADKVVVVVEGDTVIIKKLRPSRVTSIAARSRARPMPMREIVKEVRSYRKSKHPR